MLVPGRGGATGPPHRGRLYVAPPRHPVHDVASWTSPRSWSISPRRGFRRPTRASGPARSAIGIQVYLSAADRLTHGQAKSGGGMAGRLGRFRAAVPGRSTFPRRCFGSPPKSLPSSCVTCGRPTVASARRRGTLATRKSTTPRAVNGWPGTFRPCCCVWGSMPCCDPRQGTKGRPQYQVMVMGHDDILAFADRSGRSATTSRRALADCRQWLDGRDARTRTAT